MKIVAIRGGEIGRPGTRVETEAFDLAAAEAKRALPPHHLYVCMAGAAELSRHLSFRDFMRKHPEWVRRLSELKVFLCEHSGDDRQAYIDGKAKMVQQITELAIRSSEPTPPYSEPAGRSPQG